MFNFKNGISPVIAVILLLAITVVISMSMYSFLQDYTENTTSSLSSSNFNSVKVIGMYGDNLYLSSEESELFSLFQIKDLDGNIQCEIRDSKQSTFQGDTRLLMTFDEDTFNGTHILDQSGFDNHGFVNGSTYTEENCVTGGCFNFDGVDDYIFVSDSNSLDILDELSISILFNPSETIKENNSYLFSKLSFDFVGRFFYNSSYGFKYSDSKTETSFRVSQDGTVNRRVEVNNSLFLDEEYYHYTATFNAKSKLMKLYLNGKYLESLELSSSNNIFSSNTNLLIGAQNNLTGSLLTQTNHFNGTIDEFAIYSKALNEEEILKLHDLRRVVKYEQLLSSKSKEINLSNCNLNKGSKYEFIGILESGNKISEKFTVK